MVARRHRRSHRTALVSAQQQRVRVTIESVPLVIQPAQADIWTFDPPRRGESIRSLAPSANDRSEGRKRFEVIVDGWRFEVVTEPAGRAELRDRAARAAAEQQHTSRVTLRAQIPGRVVRLWVAEGEAVEAGQRLMAIEAMKMENELRAPRAGVVSGIHVGVGQRVERAEELLSID